MEEKVLVAARLDKSEAFVRQFFDRAFSHLCFLQCNSLDKRTRHKNADESLSIG
jgi:hypothetical protein